MTKECTKCRRFLPLERFSRDRTHRDGRRSHCKDCFREYMREKKERDPAYRDRCLASTRRWKSDHPYSVRRQDIKDNPLGVTRPRTVVRGMLLKGEIAKPRKCENCGTTTSELQAHHDDHSKPREIAWLCLRCHGRKHRKATIRPSAGGAGGAQQISPPVGGK